MFGAGMVHIARDFCHRYSSAGEQKTKSPKATTKLITTCIAFLKQYFGRPYQPSSGLQMLLNF